jgi:hypothetical protein
MAFIPKETMNQFWDQFMLTGFPSGVELGGIPLRGATYQLTSAQLLALQTTAVTLWPPPGMTIVTGGGLQTPPDGYALYPIRMAANYIYGSTAYTIGNADNAFQIEYVGKSTALLSMTVTGLVDQTNNVIAVNNMTSPGTKFSQANCQNLGLEVKLVGTAAALTLGNGTVYLHLLYGILPLF